MKSQKLLHSTLLVLTPLLAFIFITTLRHPLICDMMTQAFPWRYFIGECLQNHHLPLWNPYQHLGYPIHADPQSGAWYLPVWIIGYFFGYTMVTMVTEFLFHLIIAGFGMQFLARRLKISDTTATLLGVAYACSGFFVGHAQHLHFIISAAWMPFVMGSFIRFLDTKQWKDALLLPLVLWLMLTGGYPGFTIIFAYFLAILLVWQVWSLYRARQSGQLRKISLQLVAAFFLTILLCAPLFISIGISMPHITRGAGTSLAQALVCPFSPQCSLSFLFPLAAVANITWYNTDYSMTNAYFGLIPFLFFLISLRFRDNSRKWLFLGFAFFCFLASLGAYLPLREFMYHYFPLMDFFRMPGIFRLFVIIGFLVGAGFGMDKLLDPENKSILRNFKVLLWILMISGLAAFLFAAFKTEGHFSLVFRQYFLSFLQKPGIPENLLISSLLFLLITSTSLVVVYRVHNRSVLLTLLLLITTADMILTANLNGPVTVYSEQFNAREMQQEMKKLPKGFAPPLYRPVTQNREGGLAIQALYLNMNCFYKQPAWDGYNPFALRSYEDFQFKRGPEFEKTILNPPYFLIGQDSLVPVLTAFAPDQWTFCIQSNKNDTLCLLQNIFPGWQVTVNEKKQIVLPYQATFLSIPILKGESIVDFRYRPAFVVYAFYASLLVLFCLAGIHVYFILAGFRLENNAF